MNPILELAEWHDGRATECDGDARSMEPCDDDTTLHGLRKAARDSYLSDAARHRATAAALRAKRAIDCAMASGTLAWVRDTRALISDPAVLTAIENANKADDECNRLLQEIKS